MALFNATHGPDLWITTTHWGSSADVCSWFGVSCAPNGSVVALNLTANGLYGSLPVAADAAPCALADLQALTLSENSIRGALPRCLAQLTRLQRLDLHTNDLEHGLEPLRGAPDLRFLDLSHNNKLAPALAALNTSLSLETLRLTQTQLQGDLALLPSLAHLTEVDLADNDLSDTLLPNLTGLAALQVLKLQNTGLIGDVAAALCAPALVIVDLDNNGFSGPLPSCMPASLVELIVSDNALVGPLPPRLCRLPLMISLIVSGNAVGALPDCWDTSPPPVLKQLMADATGLAALPSSLGALADLLQLSVSNNAIVELPRGLANLTQLYSLDVSDNLLTALPPALCGATRLAILGLGGNSLAAGGLPGCLGALQLLDSLDLSLNALNGSLPSPLCDLSHMRFLNLANNSLESLPACIGPGWPLLEVLRAEGNALAALPNTTCQLSSLTTVDLNDNRLTTLPPCIGRLTGVQKLALELNRLQRLPASLCNLTAVEQLALGRNNLSLVPACLFTLQRVSVVSLLHNDLTALPEALPGPASTVLARLYLSHNNLSSLPRWVCELPALSDLRCDFNALTLQGLQHCNLSSIPALQTLTLRSNRLTAFPPLEGATQLQELVVSRNDVKSLPLYLSRLPRLLRLYATDCGLSGPFPAHLCDCAKLNDVNLDKNALEGNIPACIGTNLPRLLALSMASNRLNGSLPSSLCQLRVLSELDLTGNRLTGAIPACLFQLQLLSTVFLEANALSGSLPETICDARFLQLLDVGLNQLSGPLPPCLPPHMTSFYAVHNALVGPVFPVAYCGLQSLTDYHVSFNQLSGSLPDCLGQMASLESFYVSENKLHGGLPDMHGATALRDLVLSATGLSGPIPAALGHLSALRYLMLADNHLSGRVPASLCHLSRLEILQLDGSKALEGPLPLCIYSLPRLNVLQVAGVRLGLALEDVCKLQRLVYLAADGAGLHGPIPDCLGGLSSLVNISLSQNSLEGELPLALAADNSSLTYINVASNRLGGNLSAPLASLLSTAGQLQYLILSDNRFSGELRLADDLVLRAPLEVLALNSNRLRGRLPPALGGLPHLRVLVAGSNHFTQLPAELSQLALLQQVDLSHADLAGGLDVFQNLSRLARVSLQRNALRGAIPPWLARHTGLYELRLDLNHFSGPLPHFPAAFFERFEPGHGKENASDFDLLFDAGAVALSLLDGNLIGCPIPEKLARLDEGGRHYSCGYSKVQRVLILVGALLCLFFAAWLANVLAQRHAEAKARRASAAQYSLDVSDDEGEDSAGGGGGGGGGGGDTDNLTTLLLPPQTCKKGRASTAAAVPLMGPSRPSAPSVSLRTLWRRTFSAAPATLAGRHAGVASISASRLAAHGALSDPDVAADLSWRLLCLVAIATLTLLYACVLLPSYLLAPSAYEHRYFLSATLAYLNGSGGAAWSYIAAAVAGLLGPCMVFGVLHVGAQRHLRLLVARRVQRSAAPRARHRGADVAAQAGWLLLGVLVLLTALILQVGINVSFLMAESALLVPEEVEVVMILLFVAAHEAVHFLVVPRVVSVIFRLSTRAAMLDGGRDARRARRALGTRSALSFHLTTILLLFNSLYAPLAGSLMFDSSCFRYQIFPPPLEEAGVPVEYCSYYEAIVGDDGVEKSTRCLVESTFDVRVPIRPDYTVDQTCLGNIVGRYTSAFILIFVFRGLCLTSYRLLRYMRAPPRAPHAATSTAPDHASDVHGLEASTTHFATVVTALTVGLISPPVAVAVAVSCAFDLAVSLRLATRRQLAFHAMPMRCIWHGYVAHGVYMLAFFYVGFLDGRYMLAGALAALGMALALLQRHLFRRRAVSSSALGEDVDSEEEDEEEEEGGGGGEEGGDGGEEAEAGCVSEGKDMLGADV